MSWCPASWIGNGMRTLPNQHLSAPTHGRTQLKTKQQIHESLPNHRPVPPRLRVWRVRGAAARVRDIDYIVCSCGGRPVEIDTTVEEDKQFGCGKPGCCAHAYQCDKCKTKWIFSLEAPEVE